MIFISRTRLIALVVVLLTVNLVQTTPSYGQSTPNPTSVFIGGFHLVSPTEGWIWLTKVEQSISRLYWTKDSGHTWTDITPLNLYEMGIGAVSFVDNRHGFIISTTQDPANFHAIYLLSQTMDNGKTWDTIPLNASLTWWPADMSLQFLDVHTGWLRVREQHSSNFDIGAVVKTTDGGATWKSLNLPIDFNAPVGDPVYFVTDQLGWIAGRTGGGAIQQNLLYRTQDGGQTWQTQTVGVVPSGISMRIYQLPQFVNAQDGLLTVQNGGARNGDATELYLTQDGGVTWRLDSSFDGYGIVKLIDSTHWIGVVYPVGIVKRTIGRNAISMILSQDPALTTIGDMDFVSPSAAFAVTHFQICPPNPTPGQCVELEHLLYTSNGGQTWQPLALPEITPS